MLAEIFAAILIGVAAGTFTGLIPGIHVNLIAAMMLSLSGLLLRYTDVLPLAVFIVSMSVTHSFLSTLPAIFLGAPDDATALGVLPGHRYLLRGQGLMAAKLTLVGSFAAVLISVAFFPLFMAVIRAGYPTIQRLIPYLLIATAVFMVARDRKRLWALFVLLFAGALGMIVLNMGLSNPLLPLLSGMFGIATLLISLNEQQSVPSQQRMQEIRLRPWITIKALCSGQLSGFLTSVLPGLGASTAAVLSLQVTRKLGDNGFMVLIGSISTVNFVLSLATWYVLDKARNGSIVAVKGLFDSLDMTSLMVLLAATLVSASIALFAMLRIGELFSTLIPKVNYRMLVLGIIGLIILLVLAISGWIGLIVLVSSTAVGLVPAIKKTARTHAMGCILIPVTLYFLL